MIGNPKRVPVPPGGLTTAHVVERLRAMASKIEAEPAAQVYFFETVNDYDDLRIEAVLFSEVGRTGSGLPKVSGG